MLTTPLLLAVALVVSRYVLPAVFKTVARVPELLLVGALAWCFAVGGLAGKLGLSREMGALIAQSQADKVEGMVDRARGSAEIVTGGGVTVTVARSCITVPSGTVPPTATTPCAASCKVVATVEVPWLTVKFSQELVFPV